MEGVVMDVMIMYVVIMDAEVLHNVINHVC